MQQEVNTVLRAKIGLLTTDNGTTDNKKQRAKGRAQDNLCDPCVLGTTNDPNFVTFVLFVVTNCLTTKDAKYTKEEIQRTPENLKKFNHRERRRKTADY